MPANTEASNPSPLLNVKETAKFLRVSESLIWVMLRRGEITARRFGDRVFFSRTYLERFCESGEPAKAGR